jgi:hypothetical protein
VTSLLEVPEIIEPRPIWLKEHEECDKMFTPQEVVHLSSTRGKLQITVCPACGYEDVVCLHIYNDVDTSTVTIKCLLCGG